VFPTARIRCFIRLVSEDEDDRAAILRRRAVFVVSTLAGIGLNTACGDPKPCLKMADPNRPTTSSSTDAATGQPPADSAGDPPPDDSAPRPCLKIAPPLGAPDAGTTDAGATDAGPPDAAVPGPCLRVAPKPCLKIKPPPPK